jgi:hypothetical protein
MLAIPRFVAARRYERVELVTDDPDAALQELLARVGTAQMPISEAMAPDVYAVMYEARSTPDCCGSS